MKVMKPAVAGTLESSDAQVTVEPGVQGIQLDIQSSVLNQYGNYSGDPPAAGGHRRPGDGSGQGRFGLHPEGPGGVCRIPQL